MSNRAYSTGLISGIGVMEINHHWLNSPGYHGGWLGIALMLAGLAGAVVVFVLEARHG